MRHVLIIDDESAVHQVIRALVNWDDYHAFPPVSAFNGQEALEIMERLRPEIVFVDMNMPLMDGPAFLEQASERWPDTQYIVVSGYDSFEFTRAAIRTNVLDYLLKPVDPDELTRTLDHAVSLLPPPAPGTSGSEAAAEVRKYIDQHYCEDIHLSLLCKQFYFTREYISKSFKTRYGCTVHEYIEEKRMKQALVLLEDKSRSLQNIAETLGYSNASYFSKAFKRVFGRNPSECR
ncbi:MAG: response regulator [Clostridia bacterium]|nr:response regulator [Clostridia bacterium]